MKYEIMLMVNDEFGDIVCQIETYSLEELVAQLRKVEHAIAKHNYEFVNG